MSDKHICKIMESKEEVLSGLLGEITAAELAELLDDHLADFVQLCAGNEQPLLREQASAYYHIRRIRDTLRVLDNSEEEKQVTHTQNGHG